MRAAPMTSSISARQSAPAMSREGTGTIEGETGQRAGIVRADIEGERQPVAHRGFGSIGIIHADQDLAAPGIDELVRMVMTIDIGLQALALVAGGVEKACCRIRH